MQIQQRNGNLMSITRNQLMRYLVYDKITGKFYRKPDGVIATGNLNSGGYIRIGINYKSYLAHRLAVLYVTGEWPDQVDHINHIKDDNRYINLRVASYESNTKNKSVYKSSTTKVTGVSFVKKLNRYKAYIQVAGKQKHLGVFKTVKEAEKARQLANADHNYHENHGKG